MRAIRLSMKGGLYHITTRCNNKEFYFREQTDFTEYLKILQKARSKYEFKLHAYCLTSNHTHLLISTPKEDNLSRIMQYINSQYAKNYNRRHNRTGHFWGERFHSTLIESENQLLNTIFYVELNMTRNGVTSHPEEWEWSSYDQHAKGTGMIELDFHEIYLSLGESTKERQQRYVVLLQEGIEKKGLLTKQPQMTEGLIYGSETFVNNIISNYTSHPYYKKCKKYLVGDNSYCLRRFSKPKKVLPK